MQDYESGEHKSQVPENIQYLGKPQNSPSSSVKQVSDNQNVSNDDIVDLHSNRMLIPIKEIESKEDSDSLIIDDDIKSLKR